VYGILRQSSRWQFRGSEETYGSRSTDIRRVDSPSPKNRRLSYFGGGALSGCLSREGAQFTSLIPQTQASIAMRFVARLPCVEPARLPRACATSWTADSQYLFESNFVSFHGWPILPQSNQKRWSILHIRQLLLKTRSMSRTAISKITRTANAGLILAWKKEGKRGAKLVYIAALLFVARYEREARRRMTNVWCSRLFNIDHRAPFHEQNFTDDPTYKFPAIQFRQIQATVEIVPFALR